MAKKSAKRPAKVASKAQAKGSKSKLPTKTGRGSVAKAKPAAPSRKSAGKSVAKGSTKSALASAKSKSPAKPVAAKSAKGKPAVAKPLPAKTAGAKPALNGHAAKGTNGDLPLNGNRLAASRSIANKAVMFKPIAAAPVKAAPVKPVTAKPATAKPVTTKPAVVGKTNGKPIPIAPVDPVVAKPANARPMLTQGPIAARPLTKKGTFAISKTPLPPPKPVRRKIERLEPQFVVVQPPVAAVATSMKAAKNKAGLSQRDLDTFRAQLLAKRRELVGDMSHMEHEALRENNSALSNLPVHMADQGTDAYEQEFTLGLVEKDRGLLREINDALAKIQNGTYGICEGTGNPIGKPRLEAQPWARHGIEYARILEKRKMTFRR